MGGGLDERELRRRAIEGVRDEVEAFGSAAGDSFLHRPEGVLASVVPAAPQRSLFNSVFYDSPVALASEIDTLGEIYDSRGVRAWTVWVPDNDRTSAELLATRGHELDAAPRAMAMRLDELGPAPPRPAEMERQAAIGGSPDMGDGTRGGAGAQSAAAAQGDAAVAAALNDRAYGYGPDGFRSALAAPTAIRWSFACVGEERMSCVGTIDIGDDCCVTGVATPPEHRGRGIAGWLLWEALAEARQRGMLTASLQATKAGAPLYERLGFADFGFIEMWELRR